jgi:hypothetical protein
MDICFQYVLVYLLFLKTAIVFKNYSLPKKDGSAGNNGPLSTILALRSVKGWKLREGGVVDRF